jgi:hypothetical protein
VKYIIWFNFIQIFKNFIFISYINEFMIYFSRGAIIDTNGTTLTINSPLSPTKYQVFDCADGEVVLPERVARIRYQQDSPLYQDFSSAWGTVIN